ncbi:hypothetical protein DOTSEDRAFT_69242 [Dothistroma septosporum NZE10]|uniref:RNA-dependent RNA polymerase n=1 Tax=Dothistroma septosporum (strain NZE10 / CBS 128990) TaxID=675120 RepID=N1PV26_DOTSN|nr:hypothetical protein DOTSEDRAFT_69242 [Dothistroma septosporum NZE10]
MLKTPQSLMGRRWQFFLVQPKKREKSSDPDSTKAGMSTLFFFAVGGDLAVPDYSLREALNWSLPFVENARQPACKAYARLDLSASRTYPTLAFDLADIDYDAEDMLSTNVADDRRFEDPQLAYRFKEHFNPCKRIVMSDGCSEISAWAMAQIAQMLGLPEVPSVIQGRIFGAKGIWYVSADQDTARSTEKPPGKNIKIANSQIKVRYPLHEVRHFGKELLTMNVVKASGPCKPSILHIGFMPLLEDRKVPELAIRGFIGPRVQAEMNDLLTSLETPVQLREWMAQQNEYYEICNRENGITTAGGFPWSKGEQIIQMLESGFFPQEDAYLAELVVEMVGNYLTLKRKNFKIHVPRSTTVIGISDPLGCLQPGEIHIGFSTPFRDHKAGASWMHLHGMNVLSTRNPSMAGSDMQKLRAVYKPELAHLRDVVVFPSQGMRPLAGKLQGGDYDGDTFWLCWEPSLVDPFLNAPAPWETDVPTPEQLGIIKDSTTLADTVGSCPTDSALADWLVACAATRMSHNLLGTVTLEWEKMVYHDNDIDTKRSRTMIALHDYLVDADKQGYRFDKYAWDLFKQREKIPKSLRTPTYRAFTSYDEEDGEKADSMVKYKVPPRIIDAVLFDVIMPIVTATKNKASTVVKEHATALDRDLVRFYRATLLESSSNSQTIREELEALQHKMAPVRKIFRQGMKRKERKNNWEIVMNECRKAYDAITPNNIKCPSVIEWLRPQLNDMTVWDKLKASALANFEHGGTTPGRFMYNVAGEVLCRIKANASGRTRLIIMPQYLILKPRKRKRVEVVEEQDNEYDMNESLFDNLTI